MSRNAIWNHCDVLLREATFNVMLHQHTTDDKHVAKIKLIKVSQAEHSGVVSSPEQVGL